MPAINLHSMPPSTLTSQSPLERLELAARQYPLQHISSTNQGDRGYYSEDEEDQFDDILLPPPPSVLTERRSNGFALPAAPLSPHDEYSSSYGATNSVERATHRRTLTESFLGKVKANASRASTQFGLPSKSFASLIPSLAAPSHHQAAHESPASTARTRFNPLAGNWFHGSSAPVNLGFSSQAVGGKDDFSDSEYSPTHNRNASMALQASMPFTWLNTKINDFRRPSTACSVRSELNDPLLNLDVTAELFPHGAPDALAPHAFNDLLTNAEKLIARLQGSYRVRSRELQELRLEKDAQEDELNEANTRARHLKSQLESMAAKAKENEETMKRLIEEITTERRIRIEDADKRQRSRSIRIIPTSSASSTTSKRRSVGQSDSGFESADDASIFTTDSVLTTESSLHHESIAPDSVPPTPASLDRSPTDVSFGEDDDCLPLPPPPATPMRRLTYGWTSKARRSDISDTSFRSVSRSNESADGCRIREENRVLKARITELEKAVEGCLDLVAGL